MSALEKSLLCLRHPVTLLSIGLLLINDHVLKVVAPSWITGKLSDLAGLFFFPFVLIAVLGLVLDRLHVPARCTGMIAFTITAVWFSLIKLVPPANAATVQVLSQLLSVPIQIILDSSDLIALPALIPAWHLWQSAKEMRSNRLGWLALGISSLATLATTSPPPVPVVQRVSSQNGAMYASLYVPGYYLPLSKSMDGGKTWVSDATSPAETSVRPLPVVICDSPHTQVCYRTSQNEQVDRSDDSGQTWRVAWSIPEGRREFMERLLVARAGFLSGIKTLYMGPYDLTFSDPVGKNGEHTLLVALGNEGVLVRSPDGNWVRYAVLEAAPTPFAGAGLDDALWPIRNEIALSILAAFGVIVGLSLYGASNMLVTAARPVDSIMMIGFIVFAIAILALILQGLITLLFNVWPITLIPTILLVTWSAAIWGRIEAALKQPRIKRGFWLCTIVAAGEFGAGTGLLLLWTLGIIPIYQNALIVSIVSAGAIVLFGIHQIQTLALSVVTTSSST